MEGSYWLRLGAIILLALGALYVLAPSLLEGAEVELGDYQVSAVTEPPLQAWFEVADGDPDAATVAVVESRLAAAGADVNRVDVVDGRIVVFLDLDGTSKVQVAQAVVADAGTDVRVYAGEALGLDAEAVAAVEDPAVIDGAVRSAPRDPEAKAVYVSSPTFGFADDVLSVTVAVELEPSQAPFVLFLGDDAVGWFDVPAVGEATPVRVVADDAARIATALTAPTSTEAPTRWRPEVVEEEAAADEDVADDPLAAWLPNTKLNLGLDLQGGIDLTLQVDQDAAISSVVQRDRRSVMDAAQEAGKSITVRRDRTRYALLVSSEGDFADLQTWLNTELRSEYVYTGDTVDDGTTLHVWELIDDRVDEIAEQAVEQNLETLRKRVDATGVKEPSIVKMGSGRINIQLPGVTDADQAIDAIGTQATLEFRAVDEDADQNQVGRWVLEAGKVMDPAAFDDLELMNEWLRGKGYVPEDRIVMFEYEETEPGVYERSLPLQLVDEVVLTGSDVENASVRYDQNNLPNVIMDFKPRGGRVFCDYTTEHVGERFAIILDDEIRSAPNIREAICGGSASIEMGSSANAIDEASTLALVLRTGALTAPVNIGEIRQIGASLGADAIWVGQVGAGFGGLVILLFMALWYRTPGALADIALALNVVLVFAALAVFGATLTLPGIAGVALTIGMAVDANIIIFERIREELKLGGTARKAVDTGYEKGLSAVLDANVTTAIAGIVLYSYGTGPIRGFAVTLLIGIVTTLITALFVTRTFMEMLVRNSDARLRM